MRYLVLLEATAPAGPPPATLIEGILALGEEATRAGALIDTAGLAPSAAGSLVEVRGGDLTVTDGPFAEAREMISYAVYETASKEEAVEWTSRFLQLHLDRWTGWEGRGRVLKVMGPEDFAAIQGGPTP